MSAPKRVSNAPPPLEPIKGGGRPSLPKQATTARVPNWKEWKHTPEVRGWQACALSLGIDPHSMKHSDSGWMAGPWHDPLFAPESFPSEDAKAEFELRRRLLLANLSNSAFFSPGFLNTSTPGNHGVRLSEFAAWAASEMKWDDLPPELAAMAPATPAESAADARKKWETPGRLEYEAREIAKKWMNLQSKKPGVDAIAKHVEGELKKLNRTAPRGDYWDWKTIKKEALTGITGRKANGKE
jgi:hypothetical protein